MVYISTTSIEPGLVDCWFNLVYISITVALQKRAINSYCGVDEDQLWRICSIFSYTQLPLDADTVFRTLSWMLAPIGLSMLLGTDSNAGLMALAVPLVQSVMSLVFSKVLSRPSVVRPVGRSRRRTFSRTRKARQVKNMNGDSVDKGGYKSWMVGGDAGDNSTGSVYGGWDDLDKRNEIPSNDNVRPEQQSKRRNSSRRWRVKEKPLLLRMLFAAFPFLSSWTKLLF
ncbi:hypothetical protein F2Q70_00009582 [Brassica cretica]|uniref:Uncharacterized protein n=1 Tax=Brassica cretica TaxID=69181 RepID=A0A8S9LRC9_BRACR|nr:hypothetical protein F2Q70_00009582 [Brassica cretica]